MNMNPNMNVNPNMNASPNMNVNPNTNMSPNMNVNPNKNMSPSMNTVSPNMNMNPSINNVNMHMSKMDEREKLLYKLQGYEFAMLEVGLFLDTHPKDQTALTYFKQYREMKHQVEAEYTRMYGPITMDHMDNDLSTWRWIENPWPWEMGIEV